MVKYVPGYIADEREQRERLSNFNPLDWDEGSENYRDFSDLGDTDLYSQSWIEMSSNLKTQLQAIFLKGAWGQGARLIEMLQRMEARCKIDPEDRRRVPRHGLRGDWAWEVKRSLEHEMKSFFIERDSSGQRRTRRFFPDRGHIGKIWWQLERVDDLNGDDRRVDGEEETKQDPTTMLFRYTLNADVELPLWMKPKGWEGKAEIRLSGGWPCVWRTCDIHTGRLDTNDSLLSTSHAGTISADVAGTGSAETGSRTKGKAIKQRGTFERAGVGLQEIYDAGRGGNAYSHSRALRYAAKVMEPTVENAQRHRRSRVRRHIADLLTEISSFESSDPSKGTASLLSSVYHGGKNWIKHVERHAYGRVRDASVDPSGETHDVHGPPGSDGQADSRSLALTERSDGSESKPRGWRQRFGRSKKEARTKLRKGRWYSRKRPDRETGAKSDVRSEHTVDSLEVVMRPDSGYLSDPPTTYPGQTIETTQSEATESDLRAQLKSLTSALDQVQAEREDAKRLGQPTEVWEQLAAEWERLMRKKLGVQSKLLKLEIQSLAPESSSQIETQPGSTLETAPGSSRNTGPSM